ncbi:transcription termination/antitermination NusG family protein [Thomasclavelia sp.]|uniref:transcription termination/antitermination NusG family protein n=1 Tax=Thomasclavelia sp. TaxID=3025757 RepID=UPI0025F9C2F9|nr:transcription termination/antitermination NusG family protein [Thomasclavelia sp.]
MINNRMNYYVLYCQTLKTEKVCLRLNKKEGIHAFIPRIEKYIRVIDTITLQVMFPGYLFIKTELSQKDFDSLLFLMNDEKDGIIKELKKTGVSALTNNEIDLLKRLLDDNAVLKMSEGYKENGKTIITKGPLLSFQDDIIDTDKRDMLAVLRVKFLNRNIKAGLLFKQNK